jgi:uncharacterized protein YxjI
LQDKKVITDKQGQPIFVMKKDPIGWLRNQYIFHPTTQEQQEFATITPKFTFLKAKLYTFVHNIASGKRDLLVLKVDPSTQSASIYIGEPKQGGTRVARIVRNMTGHDILFGKQTYQLVVEPGVDAAMMVALCLAFDGREDDRNQYR